MRIEDERPDVLQNIEFAVMRFRKNNPNLTDSHVKRTYLSLMQVYKGEMRGKEVSKPGMSRMASKLFDEVSEVCEWRLGRGEWGDASAEDVTTVDLETLVRCLKRLAQSVKTWRGKTGYLDYVAEFVK